MTSIITVYSGPTATLIVPQGTTSLVNNPGPNTVYLGNSNAIRATDSYGVVPLTANGYVNVDGSQDLYGITATGQTQSLNVLDGGINFFSPPSLSGLGGSAVYVQATAPTQPPTIPANSIWFNTTAGALETWNGSAWVAQQFSATQIIQAATILQSLIANGQITTAQIAAAAGILGSQIANATITSANIAANTIVAGNIAANTITAAQLAAGIIYAGIVNGTTITGATLIADGSSGEILVYSSAPPALGNLIGSWSGLAGSDSPGNAFPAGLAVEQGGLVLFNQGSAPAAVSGASELYSSGGGRLRFLASTGYDNVLDRSTVNMSTFTVGNTTTPTIISGPINYQPNEGDQSSEFEIEISGTIVAKGQAANFQLDVDGVFLGGQFGVGSVLLVTGNTYAYEVCLRLSINSNGAGGLCTVSGRGQFMEQGVNAGGSATGVDAGAATVGTNKAFDTTVSHTIQIYANFGVLATGQQMQTFRTRITRRD